MSENQDKYLYPQNSNEIDNFYRSAYFIGKYFLIDLESRLNKFIEWLKSLKEMNTKIRKVFSANGLYDIEVFIEKTQKWIRIADISSKALKQELNIK